MLYQYLLMCCIIIREELSRYTKSISLGNSKVRNCHQIKHPNFVAMENQHVHTSSRSIKATHALYITFTNNDNMIITSAWHILIEIDNHYMLKQLQEHCQMRYLNHLHNQV